MRSAPSASVLPRPLPLLGAVALVAATGCAKKIDKLTIDRVVDRALRVPDVEMACEVGVSLRSPLAGLTKLEKPAHRALLIAEATAGMCDELRAFEAELDAARAMSAAHGLEAGPRAAAARDARLHADRLHLRSAQRYQRAWMHANAHYGTFGEGCPRSMHERDQLAYLLGLVSGVQAVLHDSSAGSALGVPKEQLLQVARAADCLDDQAWWGVPSSARAAVWATIPGSGPNGVDPWEVLERSATAHEGSGVRVARALQVAIAVNSGRDDVLKTAIPAHASALAATPGDPENLLFDEYARILTLHQSDLVWIAAEGHRTPTFGELPGAPVPDDAPSGPDPFAEDPFAAPSPGPSPTPEE
jgi:hypothetical protein